LRQEIEVLYDDENIVAVDKPASIPVHPCGNFKYNSVMSILEIEKGYK
jgi:tRNA pseudouridine synthase 8/2,5-diamino-6-(5-phospho-D-ribitylamino)-pyrimidin-4(3H)-one deaminase